MKCPEPASGLAWPAQRTEQMQVQVQVQVQELEQEQLQLQTGKRKRKKWRRKKWLSSSPAAEVAVIRAFAREPQEQ
jgi:hypothetical protein